MIYLGERGREWGVINKFFSNQFEKNQILTNHKPISNTTVIPLCIPSKQFLKTHAGSYPLSCLDKDNATCSQNNSLNTPRELSSQNDAMEEDDLFINFHVWVIAEYFRW